MPTPIMPIPLAALTATLLCFATFCIHSEAHAQTPVPTPTRTRTQPPVPKPVQAPIETPVKAPLPVPVPEALRIAGEAVIQALRTDDLKSIEARFDGRMRGLFTHEKFVASSADAKRQFGVLQECDAPTGGTLDAYAIAEYRCKYSLAPVNLRFAWNAKGQLGGLYFQPLPPEPKALPLPDNVREEEVVTGAESWPLPGTLLLPASDKPAPMVVFVQGSGPNDRDETLGPNKPLRDLAYGLASQGIASLRYDKRTRALGQRFKTELRNWTFDDEVVDDAVAALALVAARRDVGPIFIVGHSLGATLAPRIATAAAKRGVRVAGVVMLAAPATPLADVIVYQHEFLALLPTPTVTPQALDDMKERRENVRRLIEQGKAEPSVGPLPLDMPASAWLDIGRYDPVASLLDQPDLPALLVFGGRDFQVPIHEKRLWGERLGSRPNTTLVEFPSVSHLMMDGKGSMSPVEYNKAGLVSQDVIDRVGGWIKSRARTARP